MTEFDSRMLAYTDTVGIRLARPGSYRYALSSYAGRTPDEEQDAAAIEVREPTGRERAGRGHSHALEVRRSGGRLVGGPPKLEVDAGDVVLFNATDNSVGGWMVRVEGPDTNFDSQRLTGGSLYTHAFGLPGTYEWRDAYGAPISGRIEVRSPEVREPGESEKWIAALADGSLITVKGEQVEPKELSILTGQTVFWLIEDAPGISITGTLVER